MRAAALLIIACLAYADVPDWVLRGILWTETHSYYLDDGSIRYVDKRRGSAGERSAFQITKAAFNMVKRRGEQFWRVEVDQGFAEDIASRYLELLYRRHGEWMKAVASYNAGSPTRRGMQYAERVRQAGS